MRLMFCDCSACDQRCDVDLTFVLHCFVQSIAGHGGLLGADVTMAHLPLKTMSLTRSAGPPTRS